jgi:Ni/Co efflux regulator RcnB
MTKSSIKTLSWIGLLSGASAIAISAATVFSPVALAAAPVASTTQQQQPPLPQKQKQAQSKPTHQPSQLQTQHQPKQPQPKQQETQQQPKQQPQTQQQFSQEKQKQPPSQQQQLTQTQPKQQPPAQQQASQENNHYDWATYQPGHRPPQWQQYSQNFNPRPYQVNRISGHSYHSQPYMQPQGWYNQRWAYGQTLPPAYWGRGYWLISYSEFGLIDPPYGYVWVREGDDALLVNVENGLILSAIYGVFI